MGGISKFFTVFQVWSKRSITNEHPVPPVNFSLYILIPWYPIIPINKLPWLGICDILGILSQHSGPPNVFAYLNILSVQRLLIK